MKASCNGINYFSDDSLHQMSETLTAQADVAPMSSKIAPRSQVSNDS